MIKDDAQAWEAYPADRWVYNRLELAQRSGYPCGPAGTEPPGERRDGWWMKPIINLDGMGLGSRPYKFPVSPGYFWMPRFRGEHLSLDFERLACGRWASILAVEAVYDMRGRIGLWKRLPLEASDQPYIRREIPEVLREVRAPFVNVETIGGNVIEAHLRRNPDFDGHDWERLTVVWRDDPWFAEARQHPGFYWAEENCDGQLEVARAGFVGSHYPRMGHVPFCPDKMSHCPDKEPAKHGSEREISGGTCPTQGRSEGDS
jgi:hypothetical protein